MKSVFKEYTDNKRLTQKEIAEESGISASGVSTFLRRNGMNDTAILFLKAVSSLLDKTPGEVLDEILDLDTKNKLQETINGLETSKTNDTSKSDEQTNENPDQLLTTVKLYNTIMNAFDEIGNEYELKSVSEVKKRLRNKSDNLSESEQKTLETDDNNFYLYKPKDETGKVFTSLNEIAKYLVKNHHFSDKTTKSLLN